jgi:hypothetical protein
MSEVVCLAQVQPVKLDVRDNGSTTRRCGGNLLLQNTTAEAVEWNCTLLKGSNGERLHMRPPRGSGECASVQSTMSQIAKPRCCCQIKLTKSISALRAVLPWNCALSILGLCRTAAAMQSVAHRMSMAATFGRT